MNNIQYREASAEDVVGIVYVQATSWIKNFVNPEQTIQESDIRSIDFHTKLAEWQHILKSPSYKVWVASEGQNILAFLAARKDGAAEVYEQHTLPDQQRKGYGRKLYALAQAWIGKGGPVVLRIPVYAQSGLSFYKQLGFRIDEAADVDFIRLPSGKQITTVGMRFGAPLQPESPPRDVKPPEVKEKVQLDASATQIASNSQPLVSRGQLAKLSGMRVSTIKYYTENGLLPFVQEEAGLARRYRAEVTLARLKKIKQLKADGLSIEVIKSQLA